MNASQLHQTSTTEPLHSSGEEALLRLVLLVTLSLAVASGCQRSELEDAPRAFREALALEASSDRTANASIGDLDRDGDLDIVLAKGRHWEEPEWILLNDGDGAFGERRELGGSPDRTYTAALTDLDGDGTLDLVVGNDRPDPKRIYLNDGTGHFELAGTFGDPNWSTRNVTTADLDADARPDIIVANRGGGERGTANQVCLNDGAGSFPTCAGFSEESATTIAAGDLDGDGHIDLVVPHREGGQSYVYLNDGQANFAKRAAFGSDDVATRAVALGDLDGDGALDIVMGDSETRGVQWLRNLGGARFDEPAKLASELGNPYALAIADLDGDGNADVILGTRANGGGVLWNRGREFEVHRFGNGDGAIYGLAIGDVDGSGSLAIVAARSGAPSMLYLR